MGSDEKDSKKTRSLSKFIKSFNFLKGQRRCQLLNHEISISSTEQETVAMTVNINEDNIKLINKPRSTENISDDYGPDFELFDGDIQFMYYRNAFFC